MESTIVTTLTPDELRELINAAVRRALDDWEVVREADRSGSPDQLLTRQETADLLHISFTTLWVYEKRKLLVPKRIGRRVLYRRGDIDQVLFDEKPWARRNR